VQDRIVGEVGVNAEKRRSAKGDEIRGRRAQKSHRLIILKYTFLPTPSFEPTRFASSFNILAHFLTLSLYRTWTDYKQLYFNSLEDS
jgi:hypothetical protein